MKINSFLSNRQGVTSIEYAMLAIVFTVFIAIYLINKDGLSGLMLRKGNDVTNMAVTQLGGNADQGRNYQPIATDEICIKDVPDGIDASDMPCVGKIRFNPNNEQEVNKAKEKILDGLPLSHEQKVEIRNSSCWHEPLFKPFITCAVSKIHSWFDGVKQTFKKLFDPFNIFIVRQKYDLPHKP